MQSERLDTILDKYVRLTSVLVPGKNGPGPNGEWPAFGIALRHPIVGHVGTIGVLGACKDATLKLVRQVLSDMAKEAIAVAASDSVPVPVAAPRDASRDAGIAEKARRLIADRLLDIAEEQAAGIARIGIARAREILRAVAESTEDAADIRTYLNQQLERFRNERISFEALRERLVKERDSAVRESERLRSQYDALVEMLDTTGKRAGDARAEVVHAETRVAFLTQENERLKAEMARKNTPPAATISAESMIRLIDGELRAVDSALSVAMAPTQVHEPEKGNERPMTRAERIALLAKEGADAVARKDELIRILDLFPTLRTTMPGDVPVNITKDLAPAVAALKDQYEFIHKRFDETWADTPVAGVRHALGAAGCECGPCSAWRKRVGLGAMAENADTFSSGALSIVVPSTLNVSALREQVQGTVNRLQLAEEAMRRAHAKHDRLWQLASDFIASAKKEGVV